MNLQTPGYSMTHVSRESSRGHWWVVIQVANLRIFLDMKTTTGLRSRANLTNQTHCPGNQEWTFQKLPLTHWYKGRRKELVLWVGPGFAACPKNDMKRASNTMWACAFLRLRFFVGFLRPTTSGP